MASAIIPFISKDMNTAVNQVEMQLNSAEIGAQRLKDKRTTGELMEIKAYIQSEDLNSTSSHARPLIHGRDPKSVNEILKITRVRCHGTINLK